MESSGEDTIKTVFVDTNLDTHFATTVSDSDTVYDLKRKVILGHHHCFPTIGAIKIDGLKVKRKGKFYHLSDRMMLKSVLAADKNYWFISVDASCLEQDVGIQLVDQHMEEDRQLKNEIISKKRILDVQNESLLKDATRSGRVLIISAVKSGILERLTPTKVVEETAKKETTLLDALTDVSMPVEEIVQHEVPSENSPKEKLSSPIRASDCEHVAPALGHLIGAKCDLPEKDLRSAIQVDNHKEDKQHSLKHQPELELCGRKRRVMKHAAKNDEVLENRSEDDGGMQEVEIAKAAEVMEISRAEKNIGQGNEDGGDEKTEKKNEKTDVEKKKKRKKKTGTSFKNGEVGVSSAVSDPPLNDHVNEHENTLLNTAKKDSDEVKVNDSQVSGEGLVTGLEDLSSKRPSTQQPENRHESSRDMTISQVSESKDDEPQLVKVKKTKKKTKEQRLVDSRNDSAIQPPKLVSEHENKNVGTNLANDPNIPYAEQFKTSKKVGEADVPRTSKSTHADKAQKPTLGQAIVKTMQKSTPVVNKRGTADDNTLLGNSSSSVDGASSIDSRRNGYSVDERMEVVGKDKTNSQSKLKNMSMTELPRSSRRLKKAKISASQEQEDTESEHIEFVPESPPMTYV